MIFDINMELLKSIEKPSVNAVGLFDLAGMLILKRVVDVAGVPIVGNNNIVSGVAKLAVGGLLHGKGGRIGHVVTGGIVLDGVDDLAGIVMGKIWGGSSGTTQKSNDGFSA